MAIVLNKLKEGRFSLLGFYLARARRILPALLTLIAALIVLGWFWLPTPDYRLLGTQSAYSLAFLPNILYWRSAGYFDTEAHEKWLLHTWSLGVEAQFYLLFPLVMILLWKIRPRHSTIWWGAGFLLILSLALSLLVSTWKPTAAFYMLPIRGWELLAGGFAYLLGQKFSAFFVRHAQWLHISGWVLLALTMVLISESLPWPSGWALLPVAGTVLVLLAQKPRSFLTANTLAQWIGDRSYSLYLWHWPLVAALYFAGTQSEWIWVAGALALSFVLAEISYRLTEQPPRQQLARLSFARQILFFGVIGAMILMAALTIRFMAFENRLPPAVEIAAAEAENSDPRRAECHVAANKNGSPQCVYGDKNDPVGAILLGDSHAASLATALGAAAQTHDHSISLWSLAGFTPLKDAQYFNKKRQESYPSFQQWVTKSLQNIDPSIPIVLVSRTNNNLWGPNEDPQKHGRPRVFFSKPYLDSRHPTLQKEFKESLTSAICELSQHRTVYVVRPIPEMGQNIPKRLSHELLLGAEARNYSVSLEAYHERSAPVWSAQDEAARRCGAQILDPLPFLCDHERCFGSKNGRPLYSDDNHLSEYGNKFLVPMLEQAFIAGDDHD